MAKVPGLKLRGNTYIYRKRVPADLIEAIGKTEEKISLGTSDYKVAVKEAHIRAVQLDLLWEKHREAINRGEKVSSKPVVTDADMRRAVLGSFWRQEQAIIVTNDDEVRENIEHEIGGYQKKDPSAEAALFSQAKTIIKERKLNIPLPADWKAGEPAEPFTASPELVRLLELVRRADIEHLKRMLDRMDGNHGDRAHDPLFEGINSVSSAPAINDAVALGEAITRMQNDPLRAQFGDTADAKYVMTFRAMREAIGDDRKLTSITRAECAAAQELIAGIPANVKKLKAYDKCQTLREIAELGAQRTDKMMSSTTITVYTHTMSAFFNWCIKKGLLTVNPATRLAPGRSTGDVTKRPFKIAEMNTIVAGLGDWSDRGKLAGRWWVPMIAIYSGMRMGEIVTLGVDDIGVRDGIECFVLRKTADRSLKTPGSERVIPIHPELIKLGLPQRVAKIRDQGGGRLFPELPGEKQDEISDLFQKRFAYWQKKTLGIAEKGVSFHSFRHGFRDALREAGVPIDSTRALGGWARSGGVEERYGQGTRPSTLAKWMAEVSYKGLILPSAATS
ncbi:site-specific integrase [Rhizobium ruizarguesonis]|uniref:site-specific integrase n=1 Tax=Rhizobium ruizarguesonis TaxID=2081791 RepID=UPI0010307F2A|nr:site-specific integrase [Rhizobium ruizarguesonis]TAV33693.1 site-specific integrase [Rhizobium ruizarguesonis]TAV38553.1 site-specific integrase [Rhizobium ruizarguesonis]TAW65648.1 site-specific integrase [Rhizobium ruizarguesonis]TAZ57668.1 site-specific integrase [Rhizobium ruizarguesonis]